MSLVERLRRFVHGADHPIRICGEAADEIERLRAANKHYEYFAKTVKTQYEGQGFTGIDHALHTLRKALREDEDE